jgi:excisionase family DNA binding protein
MLLEDDGPRAYTVRDAAQRVGISEVQLRRIIKRGELKTRRVGRRILVTADALREWMNEDQP